jgi:hypothetical protein
LAEPGNLYQFESIVSELRVADILASKGKRIALLTPPPHPQTASPDMLVNDQRDAYVEVTRLTEDETVRRMMDQVVAACNSKGLVVRVDADLGRELSIPAVDHVDRDDKESHANTCFQEFFSTLQSNSSPVLPLTINTSLATFELQRTPRPHSGWGMISTRGFVVPSQKYISKIEDDLTKKGRKRESWGRRRREKLYIVAIDWQGVHADRGDVKTALLGSTDSYGPGASMPTIRLPGKVNRAISRGWQSYLLSQCVIPNRALKTLLDFRVVSNRGFYYRRKVAKNISAVITLSGNSSSILPNPYADDEINDPSLVNYV